MRYRFNLLIKVFFLILFIGLTAFLFAFQFPEHLGNTAYNFHAKYAKYFEFQILLSIVFN